MRASNTFRLLLAGAAAITAPSSAHAATYLVTYDARGTSFSGTLTTTDTANAQGFFTVTGLSGTRDGAAVTLLAPGSFPLGSAANDNLFKPTPQFFTFNGVSYTAGGLFYNIFAGGSSGLSECISTAASSCNLSAFNPVSNFNVATTAPVPEPATWAMMLLGFGFIGGAMRSAKRKQKVTVSYA